jgi:hypothetical protein
MEETGFLFRAADYGPEVSAIALDGDGERLMCEQARRQPGSEMEARAQSLQRVEWQLLFDFCARSST